MDYRERRREQARHRKLGTIVLVSSAFCGLLAGWVVGFFVPIPIPFAPLIAGAFVAIAVYGSLKKSLGYDQRKASSQHLKGDSSSETVLPSHLVTEAPVFDDQTGDPSEPPEVEEEPESTPGAKANGVVSCPRCNMNVIPKSDGICPSCQSVISQD